ncbi:MAG: hypothetical protein U9N34_11120, partial [Candidatus Cloacimonadota bacterium]|nr:hypothetical protein [Candidatus Cloacimonadota bacterium]
DNSHSFFGKVIAKFTGSKWTHSGIVFSHSWNYIIIAEALERGFVLKKHSRKSLEKRYLKGTIQVRRSVQKLGGVKNSISRLLGVKYGWVQLLKISWKIISGKSLSADKEKTLICSEGVAISLRGASDGRIDIGVEFGIETDYVTPKLLSLTKFLDTIDVTFLRT